MFFLESVNANPISLNAASLIRRVHFLVIFSRVLHQIAFKPWDQCKEQHSHLIFIYYQNTTYLLAFRFAGYHTTFPIFGLAPNGESGHYGELEFVNYVPGFRLTTHGQDLVLSSLS